MIGENIWVGIDAGDENSLLSAINGDEELVLEATVATDIVAVTALLEQLEGHTIQQIAIEAGAVGTHLVRGLKRAGLPVVVYETRRVSKYLRVRLNKTDSNDARGLAEIAKLGRSSFSKVHTKSAEIQRIRSQLVFRHKLTLHRVACESMMRSLIRLNGGRLRASQSAAALERNVDLELERMKAELDVDLAADIKPLLSFALNLRAFLKTLEVRLTEWAKAHPVCSRFMEIPGVGAICAISFYTAIEEPDRFNRATDVGPYLGLAPTVFQSGKSLRHARISKRGNKLTRSHLTLAAGILLVRCADNPLKTWGKAVAQRAGAGKARVALARKLAVLMLAIWKSGEHYHPRRTA